jgi:hypothetical protein
LLLSCKIVPFAGHDAHEVGKLLSAAVLKDVVDAHLVIVAARTNSTIFTSDPDDLRRLATHLPIPVEVRSI